MAMGPYLEFVLLLMQRQETTSQFYLKTSSVLSQPLPWTPAPNIMPFSYYSTVIWAIAGHSIGAAEKRQALLPSE